MSIAALFKQIGAPLRVVHQSWGAVRTTGDAVVFRVWQDECRMQEGRTYMRLSYFEKFPADSQNFSFQERMEHIEKVRNGCGSYMLICVAEDTRAVPRKIRTYHKDELRRGGEIVQIDGDWWLELGPRVSVASLAKN